MGSFEAEKRTKRAYEREGSDERQRGKKKRDRVKLHDLGLSEIGDDDFYVMAVPFRKWLFEERGKHLTEIPSRDLRDYEFVKFCRAYNKGKLPAGYYDLDRSTQPSSSNRTLQGPSVPRPIERLDDLMLRREQETEERDAERGYQQQLRKRERRETREDERAQRETGRDRLAEKRAEARTSNRYFAGRNEGAGLEVSDSFLMGSDSFATAVAARDRAQTHKQERRRLESETRQAELNEKRNHARQKEDSTMQMLREMAAARYGGAPA